jgi:hypothetical protein
VASAAPDAGRWKAAARARLYRAPERSYVTLAVALACGVAVAIGYRARDEMLVEPEEGLGYALGIVGLAQMSLLLLYSLRKRIAGMRGWGALRHWFGIHMVLGIVGPTAILFHANFQVRSTNAGVALIAMLTVAASGFFGRFIYTRVHHGLFGQRQSLRELDVLAGGTRALLSDSLAGFSAAEQCVRDFEQRTLAAGRGAISGAWLALTVGARKRWTRRSARRSLRTAPGDVRWRNEAFALLDAHLDAVGRVAVFQFWERLFRIWHALHFPLTVALFLAALIHVVAVHVY